MQNDRYAAYEMIGKQVRFRLPKRLGSTLVSGVVDEVYRMSLNTISRSQ